MPLWFHCKSLQTLGVSLGRKPHTILSVPINPIIPMMRPPALPCMPPMLSQLKTRPCTPTRIRLLTRLRVERKKSHFFAKNTSKWFDKMILDDILCLVLRLLSSSGRAERLIKNQKKLKIPFDKTNFYVILYLTLFWCSSAAEKQVLIKNLKNLQKFAWQAKQWVIYYETPQKSGCWLKIE